MKLRRSRSTPRALAFAALASLTASACAPGVYLHRLRPAPHNFGAVRRLAVSEIAGPPEAMGVVWAELSRQITSEGWFQLYAQPPAMRAAPVSMGLEPAGMPLTQTEVAAELYVIAQIHRWDLEESTSVEKRMEDGKEVHRRLRQATGTVRLGFQIVDAASNRVVFANEFSGIADGPKVEVRKAGPNPLELLQVACARAIGGFLSRITPSAVVEKMVLDDDEPPLKEGVALCKQGRLEAAMASFQRALEESHETSAGATFNLGVLWEARGEYARAEELYRRALALGSKEIHQNALNDLHRRMAEEKALQ